MNPTPDTKPKWEIKLNSELITRYHIDVSILLLLFLSPHLLNISFCKLQQMQFIFRQTEPFKCEGDVIVDTGQIKMSDINMTNIVCDMLGTQTIWTENKGELDHFECAIIKISSGLKTEANTFQSNTVLIEVRLAFPICVTFYLHCSESNTW